MAATYAPIKEVADYFKVSVSTIRNWIRQGLIPEDTYIKIGETYRFNLGLVENALLRTKTENVMENDNE
jgi:excisionase family DNA binding protein